VGAAPVHGRIPLPKRPTFCRLFPARWPDSTSLSTQWVSVAAWPTSEAACRCGAGQGVLGLMGWWWWRWLRGRRVQSCFPD
jgi:hypothetical protein